MNKNKKITLLTVVALTTLFATGCGMKPENIKEEVEAFIESHDKVGAAMLMDAGVVGVKKNLEENKVEVDIDKYLVYDKVLSEEMSNIKKLKSKELKKLTKEADRFYSENKELLEKLKNDDISIEQYSSELEKLEEESIENLEKSKLMNSYLKLRKKAGMEEITSIDSAERWMEVFKDEYQDDIKNLLKDVMGGAITSALTIDLDIDSMKLATNDDKSAISNEDDIKGDVTKDKSTEGGVVDKFINGLIRNSEDKENSDVDGDGGSIYYHGKNGGMINIYVSSSDSKLDYLSIDALDDISDISGQINTAINKFCDEVDVDKKSISKSIEDLYKEVSSDKYLKSDEAKNDIKNYNLVSKEIEIGDNLYIEVTIHSPEKSKTDSVGLTIGVR